MLGLSWVRSRGLGATTVILLLLSWAVGMTALAASAAAAPSYTVMATIPLNYPGDGVAVDPSTHTVFVARNDGDVQVIEEVTGKTEYVIDVGKSALGVAVNAQTHRLYVTDPEDDTLVVVDETTDAVTATIEVGYNPGRPAVDPLSDTVWVPNTSDDTVSVIDAATNAVTHTIAVGVGPYAVAVDPATRTAYVSNASDDTVSVIDEAGNRVTHTIAVGDTPRKLAVDPTTNTVYVPNAYGESVSVIDGMTNRVTANIKLNEVIISAVAVNPITHTAFAMDGFNVGAIDETTNTVIGYTSIRSGGEDLATDASTGTVVALDDYTVYLISSPQVVLTTSLSGAGKQGAAIGVPPGDRVTDAATLSGEAVGHATGTVTYTVYSDRSCQRSVADAGSMPVSNGRVPMSAPVSLTTPGNYYWQARYSGDSAYAPSISLCYATVETVLEPSPCTPVPTVDSIVSYNRTSADPTPLQVGGVTTSAGGRLLLAFIEADGPAGATQQVSTVQGAGLSWTLAERSNASSGTSEIWQAYAGSPITDGIVRASLADADYPVGAITVVAFSGAAYRIGAKSAQSSVGGDAVASTTIQAHGCGSLIFAAGQDWTHARPVTANPGQRLVHRLADHTVKNSFWVQRRDRPTTKAGPYSVTTSGVGPDNWSMAVVEVPGT